MGFLGGFEGGVWDVWKIFGVLEGFGCFGCLVNFSGVFSFIYSGGF